MPSCRSSDINAFIRQPSGYPRTDEANRPQNTLNHTFPNLCINLVQGLFLDALNDVIELMICKPDVPSFFSLFIIHMNTLCQRRACLTSVLTHKTIVNLNQHRGQCDTAIHPLGLDVFLAVDELWLDQ